jgi:phage baseplate assembly protein W
MDFDKAASNILNSPAGEKLAEKKEELSKLIDSADGQKLKSMLDGDANIMTAVQQGDLDTLKKTMASILKTEEGARIVDQLLNMMK